MPIDFPNSPSVNDTFTVDNRTWTWDGARWESVQIEAKSAYQIAVDNGFTGNEAEWVESLNANYPATEVVSDITLEADNRYFVNTSAARTLTLPATPTLGDEIVIYDAIGLAETNTITILRNGNKINGLEDDAIIDVNQSISILVYTGATLGWRFE